MRMQFTLDPSFGFDIQCNIEQNGHHKLTKLYITITFISCVRLSKKEMTSFDNECNMKYNHSLYILVVLFRGQSL